MDSFYIYKRLQSIYRGGGGVRATVLYELDSVRVSFRGAGESGHSPPPPWKLSAPPPLESSHHPYIHVKHAQVKDKPVKVSKAVVLLIFKPYTS